MGLTPVLRLSTILRVLRACLHAAHDLGTALPPSCAFSSPLPREFFNTTWFPLSLICLENIIAIIFLVIIGGPGKSQRLFMLRLESRNTCQSQQKLCG